MSTKIYDAYRLETTSFYELSKLMDTIRKEVAKDAKERLKDLYDTTLYHFLDYRKVHGTEDCRKKEELCKDRKDVVGKWLNGIWGLLAKDEVDESGLRVSIAMYLSEMVDVYTKKPAFMFEKYDFRCQLVLFPMEDKTLCMYFGDNGFQKRISPEYGFSDYHYQNQTDRPDEITEKEWDQRKKDWDKVLGCNAPAARGFTVELFDTNSLLILEDILHMEHPAPPMEQRVQDVFETMSNYPDPPGKDATLSELHEYTRTDRYREWKKETMEYIRGILEEKEREDIER